MATEMPSLGDFPSITRTFDGERWKRVVNPELIDKVSWVALKQGAGDEAMCGQSVEAIWTQEETGGDEALSGVYFIGINEMPEGVKQGMKRIKQGEQRMVHIPAHLLSQPAGEPTLETVQMTVEAVTISPQPAADGVRFSRTVAQSDIDGAEAGIPAACGDEVEMELQVADGFGQFGATEKVTFTLGDMQWPHGLTRAALGMRNGEVVTATLPPAYAAMKVHAENYQEAFTGEQIVIVRMTRIR